LPYSLTKQSNKNSYHEKKVLMSKQVRNPISSFNSLMRCCQMDRGSGMLTKLFGSSGTYLNGKLHGRMGSFVKRSFAIRIASSLYFRIAFCKSFLDILFREDRFTVGTIVESGLIFDVCPFSHLGADGPLFIFLSKMS